MLGKLLCKELPPLLFLLSSIVPGFPTFEGGQSYVLRRVSLLDSSGDAPYAPSPVSLPNEKGISVNRFLGASPLKGFWE
jgi:hypothetical protein